MHLDAYMYDALVERLDIVSRYTGDKLHFPMQFTVDAIYPLLP